MAEQNEIKCPICGGINVVVRDAEKEIIICLDCKLITRPFKLEGEIAKCLSGSLHEK